jgi:hypothetical protein
MRRLLLLILTFCGLAVLVPAVASAAPPAVVDGVGFRHLPAGLGTSSDFTYRFQRVDFVARVWESQIPEGWRVDLDIDVLHGDRLTTPKALRRWFIAYEARDPQPTYRAVRVHGARGWLASDQLFWLVRPGFAVSVHVDGTRWPTSEVLRTARSAYVVTTDGAAVVRQARGTPPGSHRRSR